MASSQKPNTRSASRSAAAWARVSEGDAALGKPVAFQDAVASLGLPIAVVDAGEEMPPTFSPGPAGDVVDLTPELAEKIRAETDQVQRAEATGLRLPRPVSPPVERALPPVEREDVGNASMSSYLRLANRVQPPQPLSPGRLHPDMSEDHLQPPRPESSSHAWEPELTDRRSAWPARAGVSIPQVVHSSEAICEVARPSSRQTPRSISVMTARNQPRALPDFTSQRVGASSMPSSHPRVQLPTFKGSGEWKVFWLQFRRAARQYSWDYSWDNSRPSCHLPARWCSGELRRPVRRDPSRPGLHRCSLCPPYQRSWTTWNLPSFLARAQEVSSWEPWGVCQ